MESLRVRLATDAARCSAQYATRDAGSSALGARGLAGEIVSGQRFIEGEGQGSMQRTQTGSGFIAPV